MSWREFGPVSLARADLEYTINSCSMNRGLPSCLAAEDPSTSYHTKGLDIAAAAYTSEVRLRFPFRFLLPPS